MTQEEKANRYDEVVERAKMQKEKSRNLGLLEFIDENFPELKKSEDEKIINLLKMVVEKWHNVGYTDYVMDIPKFDIIAWLEKQGPKPQGKSALEATKEEKVDNQNCVKPAKVEPKFKIGDFILNGDVTDDGKPEIFKVLNVQDTWYAVENIYDGRNTIITFKQDSSCRLWDLTRDVKDGDFLVCGKDKLPFIFKGLLDKLHPNCPVAYCGICEDGIFSVSSGDGWWADEEVFPATKKQREQLEKAISDAGYIWDAKEKQLKEVNSYCQEHCKGYQETGKCFADGECKAKRDAEQKPTDKEMKTLLQTEYEKGRADAIAEIQKHDWNEEDKDVLEDIEEAIINYWHGDTQDILLEWLKSLKDRVQPQQEKENILEKLEEWLDEYISNLADVGTDTLIGSFRKYLDGKLPIKPKSQWKPSDRDIKLLRELSDGKICPDNYRTRLYEIINNLKFL